MIRAYSNASSGDEFFDAVEDAEDLDRSLRGRKILGGVREVEEQEGNLQHQQNNSADSQDESNFSSFATPNERQLEERNSDLWVSAHSFFTEDSHDSNNGADKSMQNVKSHSSLLDAASESVSAEDCEVPEVKEAQRGSSEEDIEVSLKRIRARIVADKNSKLQNANDLPRNAPSNHFQPVHDAAIRLQYSSESETNYAENDQRKTMANFDLSLPLHKLNGNNQNTNDRPSSPTESIIIDATATAATTPSSGQQHSDDPEQFSTPKHENSSKPRVLDDCNVLDLIQCDISSPLETLYLLCPQKRGIEGGDNEEETGVEMVAQRFSVSAVADPQGEAPISPSSDDGEEETRRLEVVDSTDDDDDDSSSAASMGIGKFRIINKDTGSMHDIRDVLKEINEAGTSSAFDTQYTFLPTRKALEHQRSMSIDKNGSEKAQEEEEENERPRLDTASFDESISAATATSISPKSSMRKTGLSSSMKKTATKMATNVRKGMSGLKSSNRTRKRTVSGDMVPKNAIYVRSSTKHYQKAASSSASASGDAPAVASGTRTSPFNPMLLVATVPCAHKGPAWCAAFSLDGRFLATGGEDGNVCIWAVAPKSKIMFPDGVDTQGKEGATEEQIFSDVSTGGSEDDDEGEGCDELEPGLEKQSAFPLPTVGNGPEVAANMHIISSKPLQRFQDHTADVIDLSWSHSNFLLSASLDSSVRLYHFSKPGCLHLFKHANLVASVAFHPNDDRYFISGGVDKKLRLWSIPDGRVKEWAQAPDVITAARFTPDGKYVVAGLFRGQVYFYDVDGLKYYTQIACRNRSGKHRMGKKVTGISFLRGERDDWVDESEISTNSNEDSVNDISAISKKISDTGNRVAHRVTNVLRGHPRAEALRYTERMLVSTNDSRVRLYGLNDFCLVRKYKGHSNYSMQIRARVSESGDYIASGSESGHVYIWNTLDKKRQPKNVNIKINQTRDKTKSSDYFEASKAPLPIVTDSVFFPAKSMKEALVTSEIFPFSLGIDRVDDDFSSAAILTLDYDGTMRVFLRKSCIDQVLDASTPRGGEVL